jgi:capsular exopolysaccharide synthesis family protein
MSVQSHIEDAPSQPEISAARHYLAILLRRRWLVVPCLLLPLVVAVVHVSRQTKEFSASTDVLVSRQSIANTLTGTPDPNYGVDFLTILQTQAALARTPELAAKAIRATRVRDVTPDELLAKTQITPQGETDLLTFTVTRPNPEEARVLSISYAARYTEFRRTLDTAALIKAEASVVNRLREARAQGQETLVNSLEGKKQQLDTLEALQTANAVVARRPEGAYQTAPRPKRDVALALVVGALLSLVVIALFELLDTRVRSEREVEQRLRLPVLAGLPRPARSLKGRPAMLEAPNSADSEAFRLLRLSLEFAAMDRNVRSLLVSSSVEGEGKSTTAANLALAVARAGKHVVLLDLDFRKPALSRMFGLRPVPGVTNVLLGHADFEAGLHDIDMGDTIADLTSPSTDGGRMASSGQGRLEVMAAGSVPPNPGEIAASAAVARLIAQLKERADMLIIDAPPTLPVGDVAALMRLVDGLLLCVRIPGVKRPELDRLRRELGPVFWKALGLVLTGDVVKTTGSYTYGYGEPQPSALTMADREPARVPE